VLGGARSGKSAVAESLVGGGPAGGPGGEVVYVATGRATDADMAARIAAHRARRPPGWSTVETLDLAAALRDHPDRAVLVDSLGTWVAGHPDLVVDPGPLLDALTSRTAPTVLVSEEVGLGVHPETEPGRRFRDVLGDVNRQVAGRVERVLLVVAGRVLEL
jgi:adenosyl cobinamide kinase/adenosyl cobinamide phosphate guanylyltransferase